MMPCRAKDSDDNNIGKRFLDHNIDEGKTRKENPLSMYEGINLATTTFIARFWFFFEGMWTGSLVGL